MKKNLILVIEDEEDILEVVQFNLEREGYRVVGATSGEEGLEKVRQNSPELILLDLMLPGIDGLEVCRRLRMDKNYDKVKVIMLTAKGEEADIVTGLEMGANDYVTKPFSHRVLLARIKSLLREETQPAVKDEVLRIHDFTIHPQRKEVLFGERKIELTHSEFKTLYNLASRPGWVYTRHQIVSALHGDNYIVTDRAVDVMIAGLRKKLGEASRYIQTVRGMGYRFKE